MKKILIVVALVILALIGYRVLQPKNLPTVSSTDTTSGKVAFTIEDLDNIPPTYNDYNPAPEPRSLNAELSPISTPPVATTSFSCDGRMHCSQMTSCAEATYFIKNCPNTKMDGNNDGIPCEKQWCK